MPDLDRRISVIELSPKVRANGARQDGPHASSWKCSGRWPDGERPTENLMTKVLADALVPIFAGLLLGYIAGLRGAMDNNNVQTLITFVMSFAIPSSMFLSIVTTSRAALREQVPTALVLLIAYAVLYSGGYFWARYGANLRASDSSVVALTIAFPNSAAVGFTLLASVFGSRSAVAVAMSLAIGSISISPIPWRSSKQVR